MASADPQEQAILTKIAELTNAMESDLPSTELVKYATAINHLAEARAWLRATTQPHGGIAAVSE